MKFLTDQAIEFLKQFFAGTTHTIELRAIHKPTKQVWQLFSRTPAEIRAFIEQHLGHDVYFGVSTRTGGGAIDCKELSALFVDVDANDTETQNRIECFVPTPSIVVASGGGFQCHWLLKEPLDAQDPRIVPTLKGIISAIGGDPACKDVSRVLRIPGTLNYKPKYKTPREVFLAKEDWGVRYSLDAFAEFLPPAPPIGSNRQHAAASPIPAKIPVGQRRSALLSVAGSMRRRGAGTEAIFAALKEMNEHQTEEPLDNHEVFELASDISTRYAPAEPSPAATASPTPGDAAEPDAIPGRIAITEMSNAERLQAQHGDDIRFSSDRGVWSAWNTEHWAANDQGAIYQRIQEVARGIYHEAANEDGKELRVALMKWAILSDSKRVQENSIALARYLPGIEVKRFADVFDTHAELLNVRNGTINLRTGELQPHRREDYLTKMVNIEYDSTAECPKFQLFLNDTFPEEGMVGYIARCLGYFLSGLTGEQCWWMYFGGTATSKSTLVRIVHLLLGPYAFALPENFFLISKSTSDFITANLNGVRFASCVETADGRKLDVAKIKALTGGDRVSACFKYENLFSFDMQAKLVLATNFAPLVPAGDEAFWRRMRVVPFHRQPIPPEARIADLAEQLVAEEGPGILRLAVLGSIARFQGGLDEPAAVTAAGAEYRSDNDVVQNFMDECCRLEAGDRSLHKDFYKRYVTWSEENHVRPMSAKRLSVELGRLGIRGDAGKRYWMGIGLNDRFSTAAEE